MSEVMTQVIAKDHLTQIVSRIERLEEDKAAVAEDIKEVYGEAKSHGFDVKILKQVIKLRKMDQDKLAEQEEILGLYRSALDV